MRRRGFTLIELLVATAILAIALIGVMQAVSQGLNTARVAVDRTQGIELAEQKMAELQLDPELEAGEEEGDFGDDYPRYRWTSLVEETELSDLLQMTLTVTWSSGARESSVDLETCFAPTVLTDDASATASTDALGTEADLTGGLGTGGSGLAGGGGLSP